MIDVRPARSTLRLLHDCDNACVFCGQAGLSSKPMAHEDFVRALDEARAASDAITFVGGEPTLDPELADRIAAARAKGFRRVGVQTNARKLADAPYTATLARAGLTDAHVSIHGAEAAVHDYHTGVDGSLRSSLAGIAALRANGVEVVATTVATRSNFRNLGAVARLLGARGVAAWTIAMPRVAGRAATAFDRVVPRLGLAVPFALHAIEAARAVGLRAWIRGAPLCVLGPFASRALREVDADDRAFAPACEGCPARSSCDGVERAYLDRFGDEELSARQDAVALEDDELRDLFVGAGVLVRDATPKIDPPARARAALPVLGKVRPARAEVPASTERKSGEALREIFPDLFDPPKTS